MFAQMFAWMKKSQPSKRRGVRPNPSMLQVQELESRCLLSGSGVGAFIEGPAQVVRGHEAVFELRAEFPPTSGGEFGLGSPIIPLTQVGDFKILSAEHFDGTLHLVGQLDGLPARQLVTFGEDGPVTHPVEILPSLWSQTNPAASPRGTIHEVQMFEGQVYYFGDSKSPNSNQQFNTFEATAWNASTGAAQGLGFGDDLSPFSSYVAGVSEVGLAVGYSSGFAHVYSLSGVSRSLPSTNNGFDALASAISLDGRIIVGVDRYEAAFWRANDLGSLDYTLFTTDYFEAPDVDGLFLGEFGLRAFNEPIFGREIGLFSTVDINTFATGSAAWDLTSGEFLRDFGLGFLADTRIVGGELLVFVNSPLAGVTIATLSGSLSGVLTDWLPQAEGMTLVPEGLFNWGDHLGVVLTDGNGEQFFTVLEVRSGAPDYGDPDNIKWEIDWNGDSIIDQVVFGPSGTLVSHTFTNTGTFAVTVTAVPESGPALISEPLLVSATPLMLQTRADGTRVLVIGGADDRADNITLTGGSNGRVTLRYPGVVNQQQFQGLDAIEFATQGGRDSVTLINVRVPVIGDLGEGDDVFRAINSIAAINGGLGNDSFMTLGNGVYFLEGGMGSDRFINLSRQTLIVSGSLAPSVGVSERVEVLQDLTRRNTQGLRVALQGKVIEDNARDLLFSLWGWGLWGNEDRLLPGRPRITRLL